MPTATQIGLDARRVKRLCAGYAALRGMLVEQIAAIEQRDLGRLCRLVTAKERKITRLRRLQDELQEGRQVFDLEALIACAAALPEDMDEVLSNLLRPLPGVIEEMQGLEEHSISLLKAFQHEVKKELEQLTRGHQTLQTYLNSRPHTVPQYVQRCW